MKIKLLYTLAVSLLLTGCATYYMTPQNLQKVLENGKPQAGNTNLKVVDKAGNELILGVTRQSGIRITQNDDSQQTFYFVTAYLQDSAIMGSKSTIFSMPIKPIKVTNIKKVEFDGR